MSEKFQGKYRIASARAKWHDYNVGTYFITINTAFKECYFGEIHNNNMVFTEIGKFLDDQIENVKKHYPYVDIPLYQVMPNHVHLIVFIDAPGKDAACRVSDEKKEETRCVSTNKNEKMQAIAINKGKLPVVIGGIKSAVTKFANQNNIEFKWQSRFHDRIIRNQNELNRIALYIENNVVLWELDRYNNENKDKNKHIKLKKILDDKLVH